MGRGGFEPPKQFAADLQSVPFGHSGICPYIPVSYTHLDVYKRQILLKVRNSPEPSIRAASIKDNGSALSMYCFM